jgi:hypothetical protein
MLAAALLSLLAALGGFAATYFYDDRATLGARLAAGYCLGTTVFGFAGYALASRLGMGGASLVLAAVAALLPVLLLLRPAVRTHVQADLRAAMRLPCRWNRRRVAYLLTFGAMAALFAMLFRGTMYVQDGAIWTNNHNNLGDLPWHLGIIQGFAVGNNYPPQHPEFAGVRLTYPLLVDFQTAQLVAAGASLSGALLLHNFLLGVSLLALLYRWGVLLTRRVGAALLAPVLVVFSGGLGFLTAYDDWRLSGKTLLAFLADLPHDYTTWADGGLRWGNTMTALFTTQRGLLLAVPLAAMVWTLWWQVDQHRRTDPLPYRRLAASGVIMGLVPLVHGHTFLMLVMVGGVLALTDVARSRGARFKPWAVCFLLAFLLAAPQALLLASSSGSQGGKFFGWQPGWDKGTEAPLPFWWRNLGLFFPLLLVALLWRPGRAASPVPPRLLAFYAPFALCFVVPNLFRLAPWVWDNIKVLFYWHVASSLLVAALLAHLWRWSRSKTAAVLPRRAVVLLLVTVLTLSGGLDVLRIARAENRQTVYTADAIAFAGEIARVTRPGDVILTAPAFNSPALLAGRVEVMGYEGHLWSHGLDYGPRKADVQHMYAGAPDAPALLAKYRVRYVTVGPLERGTADIPVNEAFWASRYPVAASYGPYTLYAVP